MTRLITKTYTIGRNAENDINPSKMPALDTERISRKHAVIDFYNDGTIDITDKSSNGTFVNEKRLQKDMPTPVRTSDVITLAGIRFRWQTLPEFEGLTDTSGSANTSYAPPAAAPKPALNRQPVQSVAAKQGFSWKSAAIGAAVLLAVVVGLLYWGIVARDKRIAAEQEAQRRQDSLRTVQEKARQLTASLENNDSVTAKIYVYATLRKDGTDYLRILSAGTGFLVNDSGDVITNHHVIDDFDKFQNQSLDSIDAKYKSPSGAIYKVRYEVKKVELWIKFPKLSACLIANEYVTDSEKDLAQLRIDANTLAKLKSRNLKPVILSNQKLSKNEDVYAIGYSKADDIFYKIQEAQNALAYNAAMSNSSVMDTYRKNEEIIEDAKNQEALSANKICSISMVVDEIEELRITAALDHGQSGGPTFFKDNNYLIGVNQAYRTDVHEIGISIAISKLRRFLDSNQIKYTIYPQE